MFDTNIVKAIQELTIYGVTILALTGVIKSGLQKLLKTTSNWTGYVASGIAAAGFTAYYLVSTHTFGVLPMIGYTLLVCLTGNFLFKEVHASTIQKP